MFESREDASQYYEELLTQISEHPDWHYSESNNKTLDDIISRYVEDDQNIELHFESDLERGALECGIAHFSSDTSFFCALWQGIGTYLGTSGEPEEGTFPHSLNNAYRNIAETAESVYIMPSQDSSPAHVLSIEIPYDHDAEELDRALSETYEVSKRITEEIITPINKIVHQHDEY